MSKDLIFGMLLLLLGVQEARSDALNSTFDAIQEATGTIYSYVPTQFDYFRVTHVVQHNLQAEYVNYLARYRFFNSDWSEPVLMTKLPNVPEKTIVFRSFTPSQVSVVIWKWDEQIN